MDLGFARFHPSLEVGSLSGHGSYGDYREHPNNPADILIASMAHPGVFQSVATTLEALRAPTEMGEELFQGRKAVDILNFRDEGSQRRDITYFCFPSVANIVWTGIGYKESQRSGRTELSKNGGEFREKSGKSFMELIYQGSAVLHHISPEASEFPEVIEHRIREGKGFVVSQGEEGCQGVGIDAVGFSFLPLGFTKLVCLIGKENTPE